MNNNKNYKNNTQPFWPPKWQFLNNQLDKLINDNATYILMHRHAQMTNNAIINIIHALNKIKGEWKTPFRQASHFLFPKID